MTAKETAIRAALTLRVKLADYAEKAECKAWERLLLGASRQATNIAGMIGKIEINALTLEEVAVLRGAVRMLDSGDHHCRYCDAGSPEWKHSPTCPYARSVEDVTKALAILDRIRTRIEEVEHGS